MIIQFVVCIALIVAVLMQESKGEGLGSIGGGSRVFASRRKGAGGDSGAGHHLPGRWVYGPLYRFNDLVLR